MKRLVFDIKQRRWRNTEKEPIEYIILKDGKALRHRESYYTSDLSLPVTTVSLKELALKYEAGFFTLRHKREILNLSGFKVIDESRNTIIFSEGISFIPMFEDPLCGEYLLYPEEK